MTVWEKIIYEIMEQEVSFIPILYIFFYKYYT